MSRRPAPLVPLDANVQSFRNMPLDVQRFRDSDLVTEEEPEAVLAALFLWSAAWHQVPAGSLPNDDRALSRFAGYGRSLDAWQSVRDAAMRGFVLCSDGRLYHRTLCEKVLEAWDKRLQREWSLAKDRHRKAEKDWPTDQRTIFPDFDDWKAGRAAPDRADELPLEPPPTSGGKKPSVRAPAPIARASARGRADTGRAPRPPARTDKTDKTGENGQTNSNGKGDEFQRNDPEIPPENALKGIEGKGIEDIEESLTSPESRKTNARGPDPGPAKLELVELYNAVCRAAGYRTTEPHAIAAGMDQVKEWRDEGLDFETVVLPAIRNVVATSTATDRTRTLGRFRHAIAREAAKAGSAKAARRKHVPDEPCLEPSDEDPKFRALRKTLLEAAGPGFSVAFNHVRFKADDFEFGTERRPIEVSGPEYLVEPLTHGGTYAALLRKAAAAHGYTEVWKGR